MGEGKRAVKDAFTNPLVGETDELSVRCAGLASLKMSQVGGRVCWPGAQRRGLSSR